MIRIKELNGNHLMQKSIGESSIKKTSYIDVEDPSEEELTAISKHAKIAVRDLTESIDPNERPRANKLSNCTSIVFKAQHFQHGNARIRTISIGIFISKSFIIVLRKHKDAALDIFFESDERVLLALKEGASRVLTIILETITQEYFLTLNDIGTLIEKLETEVFEDKKESVRHIFSAKNTLIYFHKALSANMEVIFKLQADPPTFFDKKSQASLIYLHSDHMQLLDQVSTYQDFLNGTLDMYLNNMSNNMNAVIKKMTAWGSLVLIPTFIASIYGMNFKHFPELEWQYGYLMVWAIILVSVISLSIYFKKKNWF